MPNSQNMSVTIGSLNRRSFLATAVSVVALISSPGTSKSAQNGNQESVLRDAARFLRSFSDLDAPAAVGRCYLRAHEKENNIEWLCNQIAKTTNAVPPTDFRDSLNEAIRSDFSQKNVVLVDGWLLSHTEARVCGLAYLVEPYVS